MITHAQVSNLFWINLGASLLSGLVLAVSSPSYRLVLSQSAIAGHRPLSVNNICYKWYYSPAPGATETTDAFQSNSADRRRFNGGRHPCCYSNGTGRIWLLVASSFRPSCRDGRLFAHMVDLAMASTVAQPSKRHRSPSQFWRKSNCRRPHKHYC